MLSRHEAARHTLRRKNGASIMKIYFDLGFRLLVLWMLFTFEPSIGFTTETLYFIFFLFYLVAYLSSYHGKAIKALYELA